MQLRLAVAAVADASHQDLQQEQLEFMVKEHPAALL
jgi:hypothetical protein